MMLLQFPALLWCFILYEINARLFLIETEYYNNPKKPNSACKPAGCTIFYSKAVGCPNLCFAKA